MSSTLFEISCLVEEIASYLNYHTVISLQKAYENLNPQIVMKYAFQSYINEWEERKEQYMFDDYFIDRNIVHMDGNGWSVYNIMKIKWENIIDPEAEEETWTEGDDEPWPEYGEYIKDLKAANIEYKQTKIREETIQWIGKTLFDLRI